MGFWSDLQGDVSRVVNGVIPGGPLAQGVSDLTGGATPTAGQAVTAPITAIEGTYTDIKDTASAAESVAQHVLSAGEWMSDPHNWLRVLYVVAGTVVVLVGLAVAFKDTGAGQVAVATAKKGAQVAAA